MGITDDDDDEDDDDHNTIVLIDRFHVTSPLSKFQN